MQNIKIKSLGPIDNADINFGDLTFFVGPQASGKSILLQMLKLLVDKDIISRTIAQYGFVWGNDTSAILERYFGEGMSAIWGEHTEIHLDGKEYSKDFLLSDKQNEPLDLLREELFYIPAQRVICLQNGWPRFLQIMKILFLLYYVILAKH